MAGRGQQWINKLWYGGSAGYVVLLPLSWLFRLIVALRRRGYQSGMLRARSVSVPVVVVGNLTAGGAGKTPVTIWLVNALKARGVRAGVVSRGYGADVGPSPVAVSADSDPRLVGDEPVLIATRCDCPLVVHPDRAAAAAQLAEQGVDVVVADDGLQHYALARDYEILVIDAERGVGNAELLPAGPLREPVTRMEHVDHLLINGDREELDLPLPPNVPSSAFQLTAKEAVRLDGTERRALRDFAGERVLAVAGIGNPERFFRQLNGMGIDAQACPLGDHATRDEFRPLLAGEDTVLMTEKDAVKCVGLTARSAWYVPVDAAGLGTALLDDLENLIAERRHRH